MFLFAAKREGWRQDKNGNVSSPRGPLSSYMRCADWYDCRLFYDITFFGSKHSTLGRLWPCRALEINPNITTRHIHFIIASLSRRGVQRRERLLSMYVIASSKSNQIAVNLIGRVTFYKEPNPSLQSFPPHTSPLSSNSDKEVLVQLLEHWRRYRRPNGFFIAI